MTRNLFAIEAYRDSEWVLLPNLIMVDRESAEFELEELRKGFSTKYRLVFYERGTNIA